MSICSVPDCDFWVGGSDQEEEGHWKWLPGATRPVAWQQWQHGEPNGGSDENCLLMDWYFGWRWNDVSCNGITACVICEQDGEPVKTEDIKDVTDHSKNVQLLI